MNSLGVLEKTPGLSLFLGTTSGISSALVHLRLHTLWILLDEVNFLAPNLDKGVFWKIVEIACLRLEP
jgi:hypothetical protein